MAIADHGSSIIPYWECNMNGDEHSKEWMRRAEVGRAIRAARRSMKRMAVLLLSVTGVEVALALGYGFGLFSRHRVLLFSAVAFAPVAAMMVALLVSGRLRFYAYKHDWPRK